MQTQFPIFFFYKGRKKSDIGPKILHLYLKSQCQWYTGASSLIVFLSLKTVLKFLHYTKHCLNFHFAVITHSLIGDVHVSKSLVFRNSCLVRQRFAWSITTNPKPRRSVFLKHCLTIYTLGFCIIVIFTPHLFVSEIKLDFIQKYMGWNASLAILLTHRLRPCQCWVMSPV